MKKLFTCLLMTIMIFALNSVSVSAYDSSNDYHVNNDNQIVVSDTEAITNFEQALFEIQSTSFEETVISRKPTGPINVTYNINGVMGNSIHLQYTYHTSSGTLSYVKNERVTFSEFQGTSNECVYLNTYISGLMEITSVFDVKTDYSITTPLGDVKFVTETIEYTVVHNVANGTFSMSKRTL